jgi:alkanesulfonate monooxygenase SsuD/methylene tetrahydromethanopterin reductase-like flavin-dependent oxidoreductase (luciferase family)
MKVTLFEQAPYRYLPADFEERYDSVCDTPYSLVDPELAYTSMRSFLDELMAGARAGFDALMVTEHGQSSYDLTPNPDIVAGALAYATEAEGLDVGIYPMGRTLGKTREPVRVAEEYAMLDLISGGRLVAGFPVGLSYDVTVNNGVPPIEGRGRFNENLELVLRAWSDPEPFAWNGRHSRHPMVNIWPRPLQRPRPPVWVTGIGNPLTMQMTLERDFGFNYFGFSGPKLTGKRIFPRFWDLVDRAGLPRNPYRVGFLQTIAVSETDERAEREYAPHVEYAYRKGLGSIPSHLLGIPGAVDIRGVEAILKDPGDLGLSRQMRGASYADIVGSGAVVIGSPATVADQLVEFCTEYRIGNLHAMLGFGSMPKDLVLKNIELFSAEVLPRLRKLWSPSSGESFEHHWWPERLGGKARAKEAVA